MTEERDPYAITAREAQAIEHRADEGKLYHLEGTIYLLHFSEPYCHAQHYLGWTAKKPEERLVAHLQGKGSPLVLAAYALGIAVHLVRTWDGDRTQERLFKKTKNLRRLCPICLPANRARDAERMRRTRRG